MYQTNILSITAETLQFEDLVVLNSYFFLNMCACSRGKSQIVSLSTFYQCKLKKKNYFDKYVYRVREIAFKKYIYIFEKYDN